MKQLLSKTLMMLAFAAFVLPAQAQLLKVIVTDKALQAQTSIPWQKALQFDDKGVAVLENPEITERKELLVELEERKEFFPVIVEPGQTLTITITLKDDKSQVNYSGKYAAECVYKNADLHFYPSTYVPVKPDKPIDFTAAKAQEEADYKALDKLMDIFPTERQTMLKQKNELTHLKNRMTIRKAEVIAQGGNFRKDPEYQEMLSQVDINDPKYRDEFFLNSYIYNMMTRDMKSEGEVTEETLEYIDVVWKNIPRMESRRSLIGALSFSAFLPEKKIDAQRLWDAVQGLGDEHLNSIFKEVIEEKLILAKGKKCPDFTFNDMNGKQHHISEFYGKVLYLDYWATWCHPCVWEIPFFEKLYQEYKGDNRIQFISFSLDDNVEKWKAKVKKDNPEWAQFILTKSDQQFLKEKMGIAGIPRFIVLNADGTIAEGDALRPSDKNAKLMLENVLGGKKR
ncbi:MAG: TlpA family protein disulfide reductase [Prevotella sp.]|nr:TlpA family protein disulfide reductase [Prevotella sp.]